jgi:antitoxin (DNA-binding transcriptional repressor) of toxin-antitoxin stability system
MDKIWPVQDAKARFSEVLREAESEPQIITYRGKPKFEIRLLPEAKDKAEKRGLPKWWTSAPKVPELKLPPRKRERMRKIDF